MSEEDSKNLEAYLLLHHHATTLFNTHYQTWMNFWTTGNLDIGSKTLFTIKFKTINDVVRPMTASCYNGFIERIHADVQDWSLYGPDFVRHTPVTDVHLNVEPFIIRESGGDDRAICSWQLGTTKRLPGDWQGCWDIYPNRNEAKVAAGRAALHWAREKVGLPPLDPQAHQAHVAALYP